MLPWGKLMSEEFVAPHEIRPRLGRGLAALLGSSRILRRLRLSGRVFAHPDRALSPNLRNPRKHFESPNSTNCTSIRARGVLQPVLVRSVPDAPDRYEIIAGERRWRAAQRAGQSDIPILLLEVGEKEALESKSSKTSNGQISTPSRRPPATPSSDRTMAILSRDCAGRRQEPQPCRQQLRLVGFLSVPANCSPRVASPPDTPERCCRSRIPTALPTKLLRRVSPFVTSSG